MITNMPHFLASLSPRYIFLRKEVVKGIKFIIHSLNLYDFFLLLNTKGRDDVRISKRQNVALQILQVIRNTCCHKMVFKNLGKH